MWGKCAYRLAKMQNENYVSAISMNGNANKEGNERVTRNAIMVENGITVFN